VPGASDYQRLGFKTNQNGRDDSHRRSDIYRISFDNEDGCAWNACTYRTVARTCIAKNIGSPSLSALPGLQPRSGGTRKPGTAGGVQIRPESRRDDTMAHKYPNLLIHLVFSTKDRRDLIPDELRPVLWKYLAGIGRNHAIPVLAAGGTANHVHLLIALPSDVTVAKAVQVLKANSSRWIGEHSIDFAWQEGLRRL
jgi:REP element-mobilizing transposase RayT